MKLISRILSLIFSPLIVPFYCLTVVFFITPLYTLPLNNRLIAILIIFIMTFAFPIVTIWGLKYLKIIKDFGLNDRKERFIPYALEILWALITLWCLYRMHAPSWMLLFITGGIIAILINLSINFFWKISGHLAAMGSATALMAYLYITGLNISNGLVWLCCTIILSGIIGSARGILYRHTIGQIGAGYLNGLVTTCITIFLF